MPAIIDNIELDESNVEFNNAADFVKHTHKLVYLTGKAGTGKTTFLKYLKETTNKNSVILAPTGVAAVNAGGQTIHSFFQIRPSVYFPGDIRLRTTANVTDADRSTIYNHFKYNSERLEMIRALELLIIDEVSMVRCDLLDVIDRLLRVFRKRSWEPFGGVQVILIGDTFQLPPIAKFDEWEILKKFYKSPFFFSSKVINEHGPIYIELKKIYRQNEQDFIDLLNRIRVNQVNQNELSILNGKYNPTFSPTDNENYITLATHNQLVDSTNLTKLDELPTELKLFEAVITDDFPVNIMPTDKTLRLKEGAQIMFIKNDKQTRRYYNGTIGKVTSIENGKINVTYYDNFRKEEQTITVEKETWENIRYSWNEERKKIVEEIIGTFSQFPLRLAWAITVHKSQGLTFEKVIADLGAAFASGQVYVALSRCTSFNGLVLKTRIDRAAIKTDPQVLIFAQNETPSTLIVQELNSGKADFYYQKAREDAKLNDFGSAIDNVILAIKYRNDLDTDIFKRYVTAIASRLTSSSAKTIALQEELEKLASDNNILRNENEKLQHHSEKDKKKIKEQNASLKLLLQKSEEFEKVISDLQSKLKSALSKIQDKQNILFLRDETIKGLKREEDINIHKINQSELVNAQLKSDLVKMSSDLQESKKEIKRLNDLKWYQKLLGTN